MEHKKEKLVKSKRGYISRYVLIMECLQKNDYSNYEKIKQYIEDNGFKVGDFGVGVSKSTIERDIKELASLLGITIQNKRNHGYYIDKDERINNEDCVKMMEDIDLYSFKIMTRQATAANICFETRRTRGMENLHGLYHAVINCFEISFVYDDYWQDEPRPVTVQPFALKEFRNRWYVIARNTEKGIIYNYALERLSDLKLSNQPFIKPTAFSVETFYEHCFGITPPDVNGEPQDVVLWFDTRQGKYIKSLPLHHSQAIEFDNEDGLQVRLRVFLSYEFKMELLSYGSDVQVMQPQCLIDEMKEMYSAALQLYRE